MPLRIVVEIARRFLFSKRSDGFLSLITWVSVMGVLLGVAALVVSTSVINGYRGELSQVVTRLNGEVIFYTRGDPFEPSPEIEKKIHEVSPDVSALAQIVNSELMISGPHGSSGALLEGLEPAALGTVVTIERTLRDGRWPRATGEVVIGSTLAQKIGAVSGTVVRLVLPFVSGSDTGESRVREARVVGIAKMGMHRYDSRYVFSNLETAQEILDAPGKITAYKLRVRPGKDPAQVSDALKEAFGYPFRAKSWDELHRNLFYAIQLEKAVISIILAAIILVASFNVVSALMMMIHDKAREIAILKAMGLRPLQGFLMFLLIGAGIGFVGVVCGIGFGLGINRALEFTPWVNLPADIYSIGRLPIVVSAQDLGFIAVMSMTICLIATAGPAWRIARKMPLEGLRNE